MSGIDRDNHITEFRIGNLCLFDDLLFAGFCLVQVDDETITVLFIGFQ